MAIYYQNKIHEIRSIVYLIMVWNGINYLKSKQLKGNNYSVTQDILTKIHMRNDTMVKCTQYKFHEIPLVFLLSYGWRLENN